MQVGRAVKSRKTRVDEVKRFDIKHLMASGVLSKKDTQIKACGWSRGEKLTGSIGYRMYYDKADKPEFIRFSYAIKNSSAEEKQSYDYYVRLVAMDCKLGGERWWFICPMEKKGVPCGRRCSILYLPGNYHYFGCRICYDLTYESRQRHREDFYEHFEKPLSRINKIEKELQKAKSTTAKLEILRSIDKDRRIIDACNQKFYQSILKE